MYVCVLSISYHSNQYDDAACEPLAPSVFHSKDYSPLSCVFPPALCCVAQGVSWSLGDTDKERSACSLHVVCLIAGDTARRAAMVTVLTKLSQ